MGIFSLNMNKNGAIAGMLVGLVFTFAYIVYFKFAAPELNASEHWLLGISPEGIGTVGAVLNFATAAVVSRFSAAVPPHVKDLVEHIRIPRGVAAPHEH
jgi:cation/acetate symporter